MDGLEPAICGSVCIFDLARSGAAWFSNALFFSQWPLPMPVTRYTWCRLRLCEGWGPNRALRNVDRAIPLLRGEKNLAVLPQSG